MLAELAIANACFATIKEAVAHSGDLMAAGDALFKFFDSKAELQKKAKAATAQTGATSKRSWLWSRSESRKKNSKR